MSNSLSWWRRKYEVKSPDFSVLGRECGTWVARWARRREEGYCSYCNELLADCEYEQQIRLRVLGGGK